MTVTATISTKDRYFTSLPLAVSAVATQSVPPDEFILFDDGECKDLRGITPYNSLFGMLEYRKIRWRVIFGQKKGQVANHRMALEMADTDFVWRLDDDNIPDPKCLENLLETASKPDVGAVGGLVFFPGGGHPRPPFMDGKIESIFNPFGNIQWYSSPSGLEENVDHLYSTFLYRVSAARKSGGYPSDLSPVGHREETVFSHGIRRAGFRLVVNPKAVTWHLRDEQGGIRSYKDPSLWAEDDRKFSARLTSWGVKPVEYAVAVLDNGLGDHIVFRSILPEFLGRNEGKKVILAVCYPDIFDSVPDYSFASIADAKAALGNLDRWNIYKWCEDRNWTKSLQDAFRGMYL